MSHQATTWVMEFSESRLADRLVLGAIAHRVSNDDGDAWPSVATIQREANISERQVYDSIKKLVGYKELIVREESSERGTNRYHMPKFLAWYNTLHKMQGDQNSPAQRAKRTLHKMQPPPAECADEPSLEPSQEQPSIISPRGKSSTKSKPLGSFNSFCSRYYKLVGTTPIETPWDRKLYLELCSDYPEEDVLNCMPEWVRDHGGNKLKGDKYGPGNFLKSVRVMLENEPAEKEDSYGDGTKKQDKWKDLESKFPVPKEG